MKYFFAENGSPEESLNEFNPDLYIRSDWEPPTAGSNIENRISDFHKLLSSTREKILKNIRPSSNLTEAQLYLLDWLKDNPDFIVLENHKKLGPAIMNRTTYIKNMLDQHLLNSKNQRELSKKEASTMMEDFAVELEETIKYEHVNELSYNKKAFFNEVSNA